MNENVLEHTKKCNLNGIPRETREHCKKTRQKVFAIAKRTKGTKCNET